VNANNTNRNIKNDMKIKIYHTIFPSLNVVVDVEEGKDDLGKCDPTHIKKYAEGATNDEPLSITSCVKESIVFFPC
jgi:hypothetical protein